MVVAFVARSLSTPYPTILERDWIETISFFNEAISLQRISSRSL